MIPKMKARAEKILSDLDCSRIPEEVEELSITFSDDQELADLNKTYRGKDGPTDVLSFSQLEGDETPGPNTLLGDIVISVQTAEVQAEEFEVALEDELSRLLIHGILHLFGYDHEGVPEEEAAEMRALEEQLLSSLPA